MNQPFFRLKKFTFLPFSATNSINFANSIAITQRMEVLEKRYIDFNREGFDDQELLTIYKTILKPRMIEEKMMYQKDCG